MEVMSTSRKVYVVIAVNEYDSNPIGSIKVYGALTTYKSAYAKRDVVQKKLDKSTSSGWRVWVQESELIQEEIGQ